jgi:predicted HTH transcriptional regulator
LKKDSEWLDFRSLSRWGGYLSSDIEFDLPRDAAADLSRLATRGEGLHLEYKEKLPETREAKRKVLKTVVAFANGAGGTLMFGVQDEGEGVTGIDGNEAVERRRLNDLVRDLVSPSPRVQIESARLDGHLVLVMHVQPGGGTIHALVLDANKPEFYVRRDGTTFYARPDELEAIAVRQRDAAASAIPWQT